VSYIVTIESCSSFVLLPTLFHLSFWTLPKSRVVYYIAMPCSVELAKSSAIFSYSTFTYHSTLSVWISYSILCFKSSDKIPISATYLPSHIHIQLDYIVFWSSCMPYFPVCWFIISCVYLVSYLFSNSFSRCNRWLLGCGLCYFVKDVSSPSSSLLSHSFSCLRSLFFCCNNSFSCSSSNRLFELYSII